MVKKQDSTNAIYKEQLSTRIFKYKDSETLKVIECQEIYHIITIHKKTNMAILMLDIRDFKTKSVTRCEEGHFIILKGLTYQKAITKFFLW